MVWINKEFWLLMIYILIGIYIFNYFYKEFGWVLYVLVLGDVKLFNVNRKLNRESLDLIEI